VAAIVNKLVDEFKDELADMRQDLDYLTDDVADLADRVTYLEEQAKGPKVFGWLDYRIGTAGEAVTTNNSFDALTAMVGIQGKIRDNVSGRIALKYRDNYDYWVPSAWRASNTPLPDPAIPSWYDQGIDEGGPLNSNLPYSTGINAVPMVDGYNSDHFWLDEACIAVNTKLFYDGTFTLGRQYQKYGMGLLVDNDRLSQQGIRWQLPSAVLGLDWEAFFGAAEYGMRPTYGYKSDTYSSARVAYSRPSWTLGGQYLFSGLLQEKGWSADLAATIWGRDVRVEYARLERDRGGRDTGTFAHSKPSAWMASADIWRGNNWKLTGYGSIVDAKYDVFYSSMNPYYELIGDSGVGVPWEKWLRNPLAMPNTRVLGGMLDFRLGKLPFQVCYYDLEDRGTDSSSWWYHNSVAVAKGWSGAQVPYDTLMAVSMGLPLSDGLAAKLTYARQNANFSGLDDLQLLQAGVEIGF